MFDYENKPAFDYSLSDAAETNLKIIPDYYYYYCCCFKIV